MVSENTVHQSTVSDNQAPVQIVRLEAGNSVGPLLHVCVGIVAVMVVFIGVSIWAVFSAQAAREALDLARQQYKADIADYRDKAEQDAFWRQRVEATLAARNIELDLKRKPD